MPSAHIPGLRIAALWTYPVKSCAGVSLPQATLTDKGLDHDRAYIVVDAEGEMLTQRELPLMALIQPYLQASTGESYALTLQTPGMAPVTVEPANHATTASRVRVWNDEVPAFDAFDGRETNEITFPVGRDKTRTMTGKAYLKHHALPNFFFHVVTAYNLLRQGGVDLGKRDYLMGTET